MLKYVLLLVDTSYFIFLAWVHKKYERMISQDMFSLLVMISLALSTCIANTASSSPLSEQDDLEDFSEDIADTIASSQALISSRDLTAIAGSFLCLYLLHVYYCFKFRWCNMFLGRGLGSWSSFHGCPHGKELLYQI